MTDKIMIAGPCAIESENQLEVILNEIKPNINYFRAGAYKPRTSPDTFQGLRSEGMNILKKIKEKENIPVVSEIVASKNLEEFKKIDIIQIGARNMQNYELLKDVGSLNKVVLLKRGFSATFDELINSAKYLEKYGAKEVILCERGIRTISDSSRFTLDFAMVLKIKNETSYKVIVDPSHAAGKSEYVIPLAKAALAIGADGLIIEVHNNPEEALSDAKQQITMNEYNEFYEVIQRS